MGLAILFLGVLAWLISLNSNRPLRESALKATLFSACYAGLWIECLSLFNLVTPLMLHMGTGLAGFALAGKNWPNLFKLIAQRTTAAFRNTAWFSIPIVCILGIPLVVIGLLVAPNNYDSLSYHLPKLSHWLQNKNVALYPTVDIAQVFTQPLAEYLQLYFFAGMASDRFLFIPQFTALIFGATIFSLFGKRWNLTPGWQFALAVFGASMPVALLESVTAQNDLIAATFLFAAIYFMPPFTMPETKVKFTQTLLWAALAFSLAITTKFSVLVFGLPFLVLAFITLLRNKKFWSPSWALVLLFPLICLPHIARNVNASGRPLGDPLVSKLFENTDKSPAGIASVFSRNIGYQFGVSLAWLNRQNQKGITAFNSFIGKDVNASATTMLQEYNPGYRNNEDMASNPWHFFVILCAICIVPWAPLKGNREFYTIIFMSTFSMLIFSYLLKFTPYATRYLITWLWPLSLFAFRQIYFRGRYLALGAVVGAVIQAFPAVYASELRPINPRALARSVKINCYEEAPQKIPNSATWNELETYAITLEKDDLVRKAYPNKESISETLTPEEKKELFAVWEKSGLLHSGSILELPYVCQYMYPEFVFGDRLDVLRENAYLNAVDYLISQGVHEVGVFNSSIPEHLLRIHPGRSDFKLYILNRFGYMKSFRNYEEGKQLRFVISNDASFSPPDSLILNAFRWPELWLYELKAPVPLTNLELIY